MTSRAALEFWTTTMGFSITRDETYGDERWIEVRPPQQDLLLVLTPGKQVNHAGPFLTGCPTRTSSSTVPTSSRPRRAQPARRAVPTATVETAVRMVGAVRGQRRNPLRHPR